MNNGRWTIPIAIAAEDPIVRYGIRRLLEAERDFAIAGEAADGAAAIHIALKFKPSLLLLELAAPLAALDVLSQLASAKSGVRTLLLASSSDKNHAAEALSLGARGVIYKGLTPQVLLRGVRSVVAGRYWIGERPVDNISAVISDFKRQPHNDQNGSQNYKLTSREKEIIASVAAGRSNRDVSLKFAITERTVKHHLTNIYDKLGLSSRLELAVFAISHRLDVCESADDTSQPAAEARLAEVI